MCFITGTKLAILFALYGQRWVGIYYGGIDDLGMSNGDNELGSLNDSDTGPGFGFGLHLI